MIFLISTIEPGRLDMLPQFLSHYRGVGVDRFLISLHLDPAGDAQANMQARHLFNDILARHDIGESFYFEDVFDNDAFYRHKDRLQETYVNADDWIVWADSDEFQVYPFPLAELLRRMEARGVNYVSGALIDRIAADGSLPPFDPGRSIWEQYPRACLITRRLAGGDTRKVALARGWMQVAYGHHLPAILRPDGAPPLRIPPAQHPQLRMPEGLVQVHHFKWDERVIGRLRERVSPEMRADRSHWVESQRLLNYFETHGFRFDPRDMSLLNLPGHKLIL